MKVCRKWKEEETNERRDTRGARQSVPPRRYHSGTPPVPHHSPFGPTAGVQRKALVLAAAMVQQQHYWHPRQLSPSSGVLPDGADPCIFFENATVDKYGCPCDADEGTETFLIALGIGIHVIGECWWPSWSLACSSPLLDQLNVRVSLPQLQAVLASTRVKICRRWDSRRWKRATGKCAAGYYGAGSGQSAAYYSSAAR